MENHISSKKSDCPMRERFTKLQRPIVSLCVLLALLFLFAFLGDDIISAVQLTPIPQGGSVLLLEEWNTYVCSPIPANNLEAALSWR